MTRTELLLVQLMEECCEVAQRASKCLRFGMNEVMPLQISPIPRDNEVRLVEEVVDLRATLELLHDDGVIVSQMVWSSIEAKKEKIEKYLAYSKKCGILQENPSVQDLSPQGDQPGRSSLD